MKTNVHLLLFITLLFAFSADATAQKKNKKTKEIEFKVEGICDMCKERIENASLIKGVKFAEWDKQTQMLTVVYKPSKVSEDAIHKAIAGAGHATEKMKADPEAYENLPRCCNYKEYDVH